MIQPRANIRTLKPAIVAFRRDIRDRHFIVIAIAMVLAVASMTAVEMFTDRVKSALERESSSLLAADLAITSSHELDASYATAASAIGLRTARLLSMRSVVSYADVLQLIELKAATDDYPLRGKLVVASEPFAQGHPTKATPDPGSVWVEGRLLSLIGASMGDSIQIGHAQFAITKVLVIEPDRGGDLFNIAPRVLMNFGDLAATKLLLPGSRARHRLLLAGDTDAVDRFRADLTLRRGDEVLSPDSARPEIRGALSRAEQFLRLAVLTTIILAGVAIALAARSFAAQQKDTVAMLRTLGATRNYVSVYFSIEIFLLGLLMATVGILLGIACQEFIARSMTGWTQAALPPPSELTALRAALVALIGLAGFALPPLLNLRNVPPLRVLRSNADAAPLSKTTVIIYALAASAFLIPWRAGNIDITLWSVVGLLGCLVGLVIATFVVTRLIASFAKSTKLIWRFGILNIARRGVLTAVQVSALGLGLMALLVLTIVRNDLLDDWLNSLPADAPNQFLINIQPDDVISLETFFAQNNLPIPKFHPMIRGRLIAINDDDITPESYVDARAQRLVDREFNLSWSLDPKPYNKILNGHWWQEHLGAGQFSVEQEIATTLGMSLGDKLTYRVAEQEITGVVVNLRGVRWDSMQVNFFVEAPQALLRDAPATYITSFRLDPGDYHVMRNLVATFPSVTVLDVAALVNHIRTIMDRSAATVEFVFIFTMLAGILVLIAAVQASQNERIFESALLKTLGASRSLALRIMSFEFITIGIIAGIVASLGAQVTAWLIAERVMDIAYAPNGALFVFGILAGIAGVALVGSAAVYGALRQPPAIVLRYKA